MASKPTVQTVTAQAQNNAYQVNKATDQLADAIVPLMPKNGTEAFTGDVSMNGYKITDVGPGTELTDVATLADIPTGVDDAGVTQLRVDLGNSAAGYGADLVANTLKQRTTSITVTVGSTGQYATINAALAYLSTLRPIQSTSTITATVNLLTGFVMEEQVFVNGLDLSWITITSVDATVVIDRASLTESVPVWSEDHLPAFHGYNGAYLPNINTLFTMNTTGISTNKTGVILLSGSNAKFLPGSGITNAGYMCVIVEGSNLYASVQPSETGVNFSDAGNRGILALSGSTVNFEYGTADDCGWSAFQIINSYGNCSQASLLNSGHYAVRSRDAGNVVATGADVSGATDIGFYASFNSTLQANEGVANTCGEYGAASTGGSTLSFASGVANNAGITGIYALNGRVYAIGAEATGAAEYGISAIDGARISARSGEFDGTLGDVHVSGGSLIDARLATYTTIKSGLVDAIINEYTGYGCIQNSGTPASGALTLEIADAPTGGNVSATSMTGVYSKIGRQVNYSIAGVDISTVGLTGGNILYLRGLPFASTSTVNYPGSILVEQVTFSGAFVAPMVVAAESHIILINNVSAGDDTTLTVAALATGVADLTITGSYFTDT